MKRLFLAVAGLATLGLLGLAQAEEKKADDKEVTTYVVGMTGVTWAGCKKHVREAFKKLEGVIAADVEKDIKITAGDEPGTQKVVFKSTSGKLTKELAVKAIGDDYKDRFVVKTLKKEGEKEDKG